MGPLPLTSPPPSLLMRGIEKPVGAGEEEVNNNSISTQKFLNLPHIHPPTCLRFFSLSLPAVQVNIRRDRGASQ